MNVALIHPISVSTFCFGNLKVYNMKVHLLLLLLAAVLPICRWHLPQGYYLYCLFPQGCCFPFHGGVVYITSGVLFTFSQEYSLYCLFLQGCCLPPHRVVVYLPQGYSLYYYRGIVDFHRVIVYLFIGVLVFPLIFTGVLFIFPQGIGWVDWKLEN